MHLLMQKMVEWLPEMDPRIHQMFVDEMAKKSLTVKMDELFATALNA
jgi:hypothetical protein